MRSRGFIVGCPRSGTTLLQSMLMSHSHIHSFPETHFFARGFGGRRRWLLHETLRGGYLWYLIVSWKVTQARLSWREAIDTPIAWPKKRMTQTFLRTLDGMAEREGADLWIEKTPRHIDFIEVIREHVPHPFFIHIVRDGRAVVASLHQLSHSNPEKWRHYQDINAAIARWNKAVRRTLSYMSEDAHHVVGYEHLVGGPEPVLKSLSAFMQVTFEDTMLKDFGSHAEKVVCEREAWKGKNLQSSLKSPGLMKFNHTFSEEQQAYITDHLDWQAYRGLGLRTVF